MLARQGSTSPLSQSARLDGLAARRVPFNQLIETADIITLHVPLAAATRHLINDQAFARMKPGAFLINTSRSPVVDEAALAEALERGRIAGAGLDVYEHEPEISAPITVPGGTQFTITGGTRPLGGPNLFHSFGQFGVPTATIASPEARGPWRARRR